MHRLSASSGWLMAPGILMVLLGALLIAVPVVGTLAVELFVGAVLVVAGAVQLVHAVRARGAGGFVWHGLGGILSLAVGALMLFYPMEGALALTLLLAVFLLAQGVFQVILAFQVRPMPRWGWTLASGIVSLVLGVLIWLQWPSSALWVIGLIIGLHFVFSGIALIMLAGGSRRGDAVP